MTVSNLLCRESTLIVLPWPDREADQQGHDVRGRYVELFVLPILGPTATWLLRRLVDGLEAFPDGYELDLAETAGALGLIHLPERPGPFAKALDRTVMFGYTRPMPYGLAVRTHLQSLAAKQISRLPAHLRSMHAEWSPARPVTGGRTT